MTSTVIGYLLLCGVLAPLWMLCGVHIGGRLYPGYSHRQQPMSELGARERPTTRIHPFINNYPIGILATAFGIGVLALPQQKTLFDIAAWLLVAHGLSHILAGVFPLDADMGANGHMSSAQKLHGIAGLVMYSGLLSACMAWIFLDVPAVPEFRLYSLASAAGSIVSFGFLVRSLKTGRDVGLHQRISYGILAAWGLVLAGLLREGLK